jgi:hypothetical protein
MEKGSSEGLLEIKRIFRVAAGNYLAGCSVKHGKIKKASEVRVLRQGRPIFQGRLESLKRFKENSADTAGLHCALGFAGFHKFAVGDEVEVILAASQVAAPALAPGQFDPLPEDFQWHESAPVSWPPKAPAAEAVPSKPEAKPTANWPSNDQAQSAPLEPDLQAQVQEPLPQWQESRPEPPPIPVPRPELDPAYLAARKAQQAKSSASDKTVEAPKPDDSVDFESIWGKRRR